LKTTSWLEVSLTVDGEMAEAVAEILARYAPGGVVIETTQIMPDSEGEGHPTGPLRVCAYLPIDPELEDKRQRLRESLWYLGRIQPVPEPKFKLVRQSDWSEAWKKHYRPVLVGEQLQIVPAWLEPPEPERITIRIDPGMAFGTGTHPSTQMCLESILDFFKPTPSHTSLDRSQAQAESCNTIDLGCGSAILSIAALKSGAQHALAVDIDAQALESARKNAELNGVSPDLELGLGSLAEILAGAFSIQRAPLVIANILAPVIIRMLEEGLGDLLSADGRLVLSGILEEQADDVINSLEKKGLRLTGSHQMEDWITLEAQPTI
jgi:ribosomal protein L11 methyltransferase